MSNSKIQTKNKADYTKHRLDIKYRGNYVHMFKYKKGKYSREDIQRVANATSKNLKTLGTGRMAIIMNYPNKPMSGRFVDFGVNPSLFSYLDSPGWGEAEDPEYFPSFSILFYSDNAVTAGGCNDKNNDCLYICLLTLFPKQMKKLFPYPQILKQKLGLKRTSLVDKSRISELEDLLKVRIHVLGDFIQTSIKDFPLQTHLNLIDGHYTINKTKCCRVRGISPREAQILIFTDFNSNDATVRVYDGEKEYNLDMETYKKSWDFPIEAKFRLVQLPKKNSSMKVFYDDFILSAHELKEKSKGRINLWKTGSYRNTALQLFHELTPTIQPESIEQDEAMWIRYSSTGPLIWSKPYKGSAHVYDFVSEYPSIMKNNTFSIPVKCGKFSKMDTKTFDELEFFSYGIYRCVIKGINPHLFRKNPYDYYCHYDLTSARELGYKIELIQDDQPNCLIYGKSCRLNGTEVFQEYVDILFDLKQLKVYGAKNVINVLWGALVQSHLGQFRQIPGTVLDIFGNKDIERIEFNADGSKSVKTVQRNRVFNSNFARIKPFLLAKGRQNLMRVIEPNYENIYRVHTDGIYCSKEITHKLGNKIGDLKYDSHITLCTINKMKVVIL